MSDSYRHQGTVSPEPPISFKEIAREKYKSCKEWLSKFYDNHLSVTFMLFAIFAAIVALSFGMVLCHRYDAACAKEQLQQEAQQNADSANCQEYKFLLRPGRFDLKEICPNVIHQASLDGLIVTCQCKK